MDTETPLSGTLQRECPEGLDHPPSRPGRDKGGEPTRKVLDDELHRRLRQRLRLEVAAWQNDIRADLTRMITQIECVSSPESEWELLRRQLESVEPEYARHIEERAPDLSPAEQKISLLIGLGLPVEEIARLLRMSRATVDLHQSGLHAKLPGVGLRA